MVLPVSVREGSTSLVRQKFYLEVLISCVEHTSQLPYAHPFRPLIVKRGGDKTSERHTALRKDRSNDLGRLRLLFPSLALPPTSPGALAKSVPIWGAFLQVPNAGRSATSL